MTDLSTHYLGLKLKSPLVPSACQALSRDISQIRQMEDYGAGAVVLYSLFEEQLRHEKMELDHHLTEHADVYAESQSFFPEFEGFLLGPEEYLDHIRRAKDAVNIPVIASLNGATAGGWTRFAKEIEMAGADALELNIYGIPTDMTRSSQAIEMETFEIVRQVKSSVSIPVAVKLSPFYTNLAHVAATLDVAGADALVLFNRFYQPDMDLETLEVKPSVLLSSGNQMRLPLRWIAILYGRMRADLAATSGVTHAEDAIKLLMAGAKVTMVCSVLLRYGIPHLRVLENKMREWFDLHQYESVQLLQGSMSQLRCSNPGAFERAQYVRTLHSWQPPPGGAGE